MIVKHRLPEIMAKHKIRTISDLSARVGYSYFKLNRFYNNDYKHIDPELIAAVCKSLNLKIEDLLYIEQEGA